MDQVTHLLTIEVITIMEIEKATSMVSKVDEELLQDTSRTDLVMLTKEGEVISYPNIKGDKMFQWEWVEILDKGIDGPDMVQLSHLVESSLSAQQEVQTIINQAILLQELLNLEEELDKLNLPESNQELYHKGQIITFNQAPLRRDLLEQVD